MANPVKLHTSRIDLSGTYVCRSFVNQAIGEGDSGGDAFAVEVYKDGERFNIGTWQVVGYFVRADGTTLVITGYKEEGFRACVKLPQACYSVTGNYTLTIKATSSGYAGTLMIVDGTVSDISTENIADPSGDFPNVEDYAEYVEAAETAAETIDGISITSELIAGTRYKIKVTKS